ncbi:hypothetical protein DFH08DRAFT_967938 [Mycena albidolilacea]|uniref:Uncharacterized protein n=1 Tax=Mycena albidolilacea TaxID=1033008 RepID=A0AAD6ZKR9_9AGAR|nr:hypothetical protein DFH08DRAFT_967938 [Mycena albidolilacea]
MKFAFFTVTAAAALTAVAAASIPRDDSCGTAIENLASSSNPGFNCLAPTQFKDVLALGSKNSSLAEFKSTMDTWLTAFCGVGSCSADTVSQISSGVNATCSVEAFNVTDFDNLREVLCLKDTTTNTFCTTEGFGQGENATDTSDATSGPAGIMVGILLVSSDGFSPCNECAKARYQLRAKSGDTDFQTLNSSCGANFTGDTVVGVTQVAVAGEFKNNGAGVLTPTASLLLLAISGLFALF